MKNKHKFIITLNAPVVLVFVFICFIVTLIGVLTKGKSTELLFMTYHSSLLNPLTYLRFFTHVFGHSGWEHFINNAMYLLILGPMLEEKHGSATLAEIIAITAVITGILSYIFFPTVALCGASGVVFAFIILASFTGFKEGEIPLTFILVAILYIGGQMIQGLTVRDNISQMGHIIGGLVGAAVGFLLNRKK
ncbi:MAG: rhomboid family intramembrane serine protease [Lachnospiraceae bacterium]|jgi:GlpG protein|nr:rhomboid family intramembrane serine protease [Lachnospiraceae bacterium]MCR5499799.1 rhomboid family intramembrane serine protease [Acetatifactor sp.]MBO7340263.1 rhomboid family intramembrane serine protease [Lachnospiraceae bacterium]MBP5263381.1 rhomboid family intramembrane serine protease [Lachnospiraceae bacterium]MBP5669543.1 rhomboid family intramembrane serine protease [Lachnospiraceae bacterium]